MDNGFPCSFLNEADGFGTGDVPQAFPSPTIIFPALRASSRTKITAGLVTFLAVFHHL
jgi:hypothetical protein